MSLIDQYDAERNPHYFGRGMVRFTAPLLPAGGVNTNAYGGRWGDNWPGAPERSGELHLPPGRRVGNASSVVVTPSIRRLNTSAWDTRSNLIVDSAEITVVMHALGADNLSSALHANRNAVVSKERSEVLYTSRANLAAGSMLFVRHLIDVNHPITAIPSWTTWTEGVDWRPSPFGIELLHGCRGPAGSGITIRYRPEGATETLDALSQPGLELGLSYTGINRADMKPVRLDAYRCRPQIDGGLQTVGDATSTVTLKFSLLPVRPVRGASAAWYRVLRGQHYMDI